MLSNPRVQAMVATANAAAAKAFYTDVLGFKLKSEDNFAMLFEVGDRLLRVNRAPAVTPSAYAVLAFHVDNIVGDVRGLTGKGVVFERYPFLPPDADGIWTAPDGTMVAWFRDKDGNLLSLVQAPKA